MKKSKPLVEVLAAPIPEAIKTDEVIVFRLKQLEVDMENELQELKINTTTAMALRNTASFNQLRATAQRLVDIQTAINELKRLS